MGSASGRASVRSSLCSGSAAMALSSPNNAWLIAGQRDTHGCVGWQRCDLRAIPNRCSSIFARWHIERYQLPAVPRASSGTATGRPNQPHHLLYLTINLISPPGCARPAAPSHAPGGSPSRDALRLTRVESCASSGDAVVVAYFELLRASPETDPDAVVPLVYQSTVRRASIA
jgi:hypothetical protein